MSINNIKTIENGLSLPSEVLFYNIHHADSGFSVFRHRIEAAMHEWGQSFALDLEEETLYRYYRNGESENYVLAAFGCETLN